MSTSFWTSLATYCQELAPVTGPLLSAVAETANAVERAGRQSSALRTSSGVLNAELLSSDLD